MRKCVFGHMWTAKDQITQGTRAIMAFTVRSQDNWILLNVSMEAKCPVETAHAQDYLNQRILRISELTPVSKKLLNTCSIPDFSRRRAMTCIKLCGCAGLSASSHDTLAHKVHFFLRPRLIFIAVYTYLLTCI